MPESSAYQIADWNGANGECWVANQGRLDAMLAPFGEAAIAAGATMAGERILDIGCGAGATSFALADLAGPQGHVLGIDISAPLIARAQGIKPPDMAVTFRLADAATATFDGGRFDLLFSRFGVMFFDDPAAAFANLRHALRPGGRLSFVCWRSAAENDWVRLPMDAIRRIVPPPPPPEPEAPGPFSFGDVERVRRILTNAGFSDIAIEPYDHSIPFGAGATREAAVDDAVDMAFAVGPLSRLLADQPDIVRSRAAAAVRAAFATKPGDRSVLIDGAAWIVTARNW